MARKGSPKVRTGCKTVRKVKCDEEKPYCRRCTSTGRRCDGYRDPPPIQPDPHAQEAALIAHRTSPTHALFSSFEDRAEARSLDFFRTVTGPALSGPFDSDFWSRLVIQASQHEAAVRHAMLAVSYMHEKVETTAGASSLGSPSFVPIMSDPQNYFALQQYNKSIAALRERVSRKAADTEDVALLACILFICIEFLQGRIGEAMIHFKQGMEVLCSAETQDRFASLRGQTGHSAPVSDIVRTNVVPIFSRLSILPLLAGESPPAPQVTVKSDAAFLNTLEIPPIFATLLEARSSLVSLMGLSIRLIRSADAYKYGNYRFNPEQFEIIRSDFPLGALTTHQYNLQQALNRWRAAFSPLQDDPTKGLSNASRLLQIYYLVNTIWVGAALSRPETSFDAYLPSFSSIVRLASSMVFEKSDADTPGHLHRDMSVFAFEMGIIPPVYFTAIKCRHLSTRMAALALLRTSPVRRENLWSATITAKVAERVIEREHGPQSVDAVGEDIDDEMPPDEKRVYDADIGRYNAATRDDTAGTSRNITYLTKPEGVDGKWFVVQETITL